MLFGSRSQTTATHEARMLALDGDTRWPADSYSIAEIECDDRDELRIDGVLMSDS